MSGSETDVVLIDHALKNDQNAYNELYARYASGIYRLCYSLLLNRQDAEDVTQEVFVYAFKNLNRYDSARASFKTWLYTIALSRSRNVHRRKRPILLDMMSMWQLKTPAPESDQPEVQLSHKRAKEAITTALTSLSPRLREALILRYAHGMTYKEIAEVMGCPQKTAESRVRLAHEKLRVILQLEGYGLLEELLAI